MTHLVPVLRPVLGTPFRRGDLYRRAGEVPSFHLAPVRTQDARDLITGSVLGAYNSASPAWAVGPDGILSQPAANAPVIEYDPVTLSCLGARIWGAVTNLRIQSEVFIPVSSGGAWSFLGGDTATQNQTLSPANTLTADLIAEGETSGSGHGINESHSFTSGVTYTSSIFAKEYTGAKRYLSFIFYPAAFGSFKTAIVDVATGQFYSVSSGVTFGSQLYANGFRRVWATCNATATATTEAHIRITSSTTDTFGNQLGNSANGMYLWGAQVNTGPLSPYVPTTTTAASSTADVWTITGADFSRIINQAEGTVYWSGSAALDSATHFGWAISNAGDYSNSHNFMRQIDAQPVLRTLVGGAPQYEVGFGANWTSSNPIKQAAYAYRQDDFAGIINGVALVSDASGSLPTTNRIELGALSGGNFLNGYIREFAVLRSRRPNSNLQAMIQ